MKTTGGAGDFRLELARVIRSALDDAARQLGLVKAALPRRETRGICGERLEIPVDRLHLRTVEHGVEQRANHRP